MVNSGAHVKSVLWLKVHWSPNSRRLPALSSVVERFFTFTIVEIPFNPLRPNSGENLSIYHVG